MKTYIFYYVKWFRLLNGNNYSTIKEFRTKALTRGHAETQYWDSQVKRKTFGKYIKAEIIENRKRVQI